jgi:hypothetical protein
MAKLTRQRKGIIKRVKRIVKKIEGLKYNEPLNSEMRIVNMICRSAVHIVKKEFE